MSVWAIIEDKGKVLLIKRSEKTSRAGQWCFPGGGEKPGEDPKEACRREVNEETNLLVSVRREAGRVDDRKFYICEINDNSSDIKLKLNECVEYVWVEPSKILGVGEIMDLRAVTKILSQLGITIDHV